MSKAYRGWKVDWYPNQGNVYIATKGDKQLHGANRAEIERMIDARENGPVKRDKQRRVELSKAAQFYRVDMFGMDGINMCTYTAATLALAMADIERWLSAGMLPTGNPGGLLVRTEPERGAR